MADYQGKLFSLVAIVGAATLVLWPATASAQNVNSIECPGQGNNLSGSYADVIVKGACTLDGATVFGSVLMDGGSLTTTGNGANIFGSVQAKDAGNVTLNNVSVSGDVSLEKSGNLVVKGALSSVGSITMKESGKARVLADASTGEVKAEKSGNVIVIGTVASVFSSESGKVLFKNGSRTFPGGVELIGGGLLKICGAEIGISSDGTDGSGGPSKTARAKSSSTNLRPGVAPARSRAPSLWRREAETSGSWALL